MDETPAQPEQITNQGSESHQQGQPSVPVSPNEVQAKQDIPAPATEEKKRKRKPLSYFEIWALILTVIGILVAGATGLAIYWQDKIAAATLSEIQKQYPKLTESTDATKGSAGAAESAAQTASAALQDSKKSFQLLNRPYVVINSQTGTAGFVHNGNVFDLGEVNLTYGNIGKTTAYGVFGFVRYSIARFTQEHPRTLESAIEGVFKPIYKDEAKLPKYFNEVGKIDMPPTGSEFVTAQLSNGPLSDTDKTGLGQTPNKIILICTGRIYYQGFDRTTSYSTDFCFYYFGKNPLTWHYCPTHNLVR